MKAKSDSSWISTLTEGKWYKVISTDRSYYLIKNDSGKLSWEYSKNFCEVDGELKESKIKIKFAWEGVI